MIQKYIKALARIKLKIDEYYSEVGRGVFDDTDQMRVALIGELDEILTDIKIPKKYLIVESYDLDKEKENE